jgi:hypothetical protein
MNWDQRKSSLAILHIGFNLIAMVMEGEIGSQIEEMSGHECFHSAPMHIHRVAEVTIAAGLSYSLSIETSDLWTVEKGCLAFGSSFPHFPP